MRKGKKFIYSGSGKWSGKDREVLSEEKCNEIRQTDTL